MFKVIVLKDGTEVKVDEADFEELNKSKWGTLGNKNHKYADQEQGHSGIMYRASNFEYKGLQKLKGQCIMWNGNKVHLRAAYQKVNGQYTKTAVAVQTALKNGQAHYKSLAKKHIYAFKLKK